MNIFRIFFVSTVLIPLLVVVATSDDDRGIRLRIPRTIVISEDGTRTARRHSPVNISDKGCPSLGCTGNLTSDSYNGKGSLASKLPASGTSSEERFVDSPNTFHHRHDHPFKLEIKSIKNSTRADSLEYNNYVVDEGSGRSFISTAVILSWAVFLAFRAFLSLIFLNTVKYFWNSMKKKYGIGEDYVEYYVKLGEDAKHPFHNYGSGWNPTFGISLKTKKEHGWKGGWKPQGWGWNGGGGGGHYHHGQQYASSYHHPEAQWPPSHYGGSQHYGRPHGWRPKTASEEEEDELRHQYDKKKGWKYAKKHTKKYSKKAHKYGLSPSKYSYLYDHKGNIQLGHNVGYSWRSGNRNKKAKAKRSKEKISFTN